MSLQNKPNKTFIYLVPKGYKRKYNPCTELIIINEFIESGYEILPVYNLYFINILLLILRREIDGIIVNSIKILWGNKLILKISSIIPIYWWFFDNAFAKEKILKKVIYLAKNVSIFFNKNYNHFDVYKKYGISPIWLDQGVSPDCKYFDSKEYKYDIVFFGSISFDHIERTTVLKRLDEKYNLAIYTPMIKKFRESGFQNVFKAVQHSEIGKIVAESKITLVLNASINESYCWSNRIHLMLGSGAFCLTDYIDGLEQSYISEEDCIIIKDLNLIESVIDKWINDDKKNERDRIRSNGYQKAHSVHSYKNRIESLISNI